MLKLQNIIKIYKSKKGESIKAINNVSLDFAKTGMTFILGKSGSGKSTLLNVIGGLDKYDDGDLIIKGKSTKNLKQNDFDSYRNTLVGFIFQEYNLLEDLSVFENIELALELQGKKVAKTEVEKILIDVDLEGYGNRQINELSGGQKQRVAIARALVKNPEIIMADEPTGALDSETSIQVLNILKKLSKSRLVIVVSHEREFAEKYADRVIELKDGVVISDTIKGDKNTNIVKEEYIPIKSKLPLKPALKVAASSLKQRRLRLLLSIILSSISFALFGLADSFGSYKQDKAAINSMIDANITYASFSKIEEVISNDGDEYTTTRDLKFSDAEIINFNNISSELNFVPVVTKFEYKLIIKDYYKDQNALSNGLIYYNSGYITGLSRMSNEILTLYNYQLFGLLPQNNKQVTITKFQYNNFKELGLIQIDEFNNERIIVFNNELEFLNHQPKILIGSDEFEIVGIVDTNFDVSRYLDLKTIDITGKNQFRNLIEKEYNQLINYTLHNVMFINEEYFNDLINTNKYTFSNQNVYFNVENAIETQSITEFKTFNNLDFNDVTFVGDNNEATLTKNKVIMKLDIKTKLSDLIPDSFYNEYYNNYYNYVDSLIESLTIGDLFEYIKVLKPSYQINDYNTWSEEEYQTHLGYLKTEWKKIINLDNTPLNKLDVEYLFFIDFINDNNIILKTSTRSTIQFHNNYTNLNFEIAGILISDNNMLYFNEEAYSDLIVEGDQVYNYIFATIPKDRHLITKVINIHYKETNPNYLIHNEVIVTLDDANDKITFLADIFIYVGIGFLVFAAALLFNFISFSVEFKKQEIGILRAIGARNNDVIKIFFLEATIIALINFLLATIISIITIIFVNSYLKTEFGLIISIITFGFRQLIVILLISLVIAYLSSSLPVRRVAKKYPIDVILGR